jgi:hypothetical protein
MIQMNSYLTGIEQFIRQRRPLWHMKQAIGRGKITIGFLGGSITEPIEESWNGKRWSDKVVNWFVGSFPDLIVNVENAAKGATGSQSAIFRVEEDIIDRGCDIVFIEYAVNDGGPADLRSCCREGLIRKLLNSEKANYDLVVTYTFHQPMLEPMLRGEMPDSIAEFEVLCEHYHVSSVFMGDYAFHELNSGRLLWAEWLPDGLHPGDTGSHVYAVPVIQLLQDEYANAAETPCVVPAPLFPQQWEKAHKLPLDDIKRHGGAWRMVRKYRSPTVDRMLTTGSLKSWLSFSFRGTGFIIFVRFDSYHSDYRYKIDDGDWILKNDARPEWCANVSDWIRHDLAASGLPEGEHRVVVEPVFGSNGLCRGSDFELCDIGIIC